MWAFDQASRLRLANGDLCMTAAAAALDTAGKLFAAGQRPAHGQRACDGGLVLQPCGADVRQTFSMLSQSGARPSSGNDCQWLPNSMKSWGIPRNPRRAELISAQAQSLGCTQL